MTTEQPLSSCVVVTVRPRPSVWEETARAMLPDPLEDEDDDALDDACPDPERDRTLTELDRPEPLRRDDAAGLPAVDRISRPSARIRTISHPLPETLTSSACTAALMAGLAAAIPARPAKAAIAR
ncbi:MAG: hypothetical protein M3Q08_14210 [Pseudomonadota bacterium]|nr:hypothetical protein [Pseudomonadota bacterium]